MHTFFRWSLSFVLLVTIPTGALAAASDVSETLNVPGNRVVTRGEFLKAAVILLDVDVHATVSRAFRIYPEEYRMYAQAADDRSAFDVFGARPSLTQPITRGEAVMLVAELQDWKQISTDVELRDVRDGSDLERAVALALERSWIKSVRTGVFGVAASLRGKEARSLLTRVAGDDNQPLPTDQATTPKKKKVVDQTTQAFREQVRTLLKDQYLYSDKLKGGTGTTAEQFVESLNDPYTTLFDPKEAKEFADQLGGTLTGIGTHLEVKDGDVIVVSVIDSGPADRAGILAGDVITAVNKKKTMGLSFNDVVSLIRGPENSAVRIEVRRNSKTVSFNMIRAVIDIPDATVETRSGVAIVTIRQFGDHLLRDADQLFRDLAQTAPTGVILDLRDNPGGYLDGVPSVVGAFLPKQSIYVRTRGRMLNTSYVTDDEPSFSDDVPLVILVNEASASAAEIAAGALQDYDRATIVGTTTFGKGTVQTLYDFANKSSLKFTIAEWLTPDGNPINEVGVQPDVPVVQSDAGDAQLEKALELILSSI